MVFNFRCLYTEDEIEDINGKKQVIISKSLVDFNEDLVLTSNV